MSADKAAVRRYVMRLIDFGKYGTDPYDSGLSDKTVGEIADEIIALVEQ